MNRRRTRSARRTPIDWGVRAALSLAALAAGYVSVSHTLASVLRSKAPGRAYQIAPWHARVEAQHALRSFDPGAEPSARARVAHMARNALSRDPTAIPAVVALGLTTSLTGDLPRARALFDYSAKLSRRDLTSRLWLIEDAVERNDVEGALRHYDTALRTSRTSVDILHPILANASVDPGIARPLLRTLLADPPWGEGFIGYLAVNTPDPVATAGLFWTLQKRGYPVPEAASAALIGKLLDQRRFEPAWRYFASIRRGAEKDRSRDPQFSEDIAQPTAFDWVPVSGVPSIVAAISRSKRHGMLDFSAPATVGGPVVQQLLLLPPGGYALRGHSLGIEQPAQSRPYWSLSCAADEREIGRVSVPNSAEADGRFAGRFVVPRGCDAQYLRLMLRPTDAIAGVAGQIDYVSLRPLR